MTIATIEITDIKAIKHLVFRPGSLTLISGRNGTGKTTVLDALLSVFDGGHDPGLIRRGSKKGTVRIELDNGSVIVKTITNKTSSLEITDDEGRVVTSPKAWVDRLAIVLSVDPGRLLNPTIKQRDIAKELAQVIDIVFSRLDIAAAIGKTLRSIWAALADEVGLIALEKVRKDVYDRRTGANKDQRDAAGACERLMKSLPDDDQKDWGAKLTTLQVDQRSIEVQIGDAKRLAIKRHADETGTIVADIDLRIEKLRIEKQAQLAIANQKREQALADIDAASEPERLRVTAELAIAQERFGQSQKAQGVRDLIEENRTKAREAAILSDHLSSAINALDELKLSKLKNLPIEGLTFEVDQFLVDATPWEHVNTARKIDVVLQIAALRRKELPFMVLDDAEHLDAEGLEALRLGAVAMGFQVIAAKVLEDPEAKLDVRAMEAP